MVIIFISLLQFTLVNGSDEGVNYLLLMSLVKVVVDWLWTGGVMGFGRFLFIYFGYSNYKRNKIRIELIKTCVCENLF